MLRSLIDLNNLSFNRHEGSIYTRRKLRQFSLFVKEKQAFQPIMVNK
jgi:hypothetical protein